MARRAVVDRDELDRALEAALGWTFADRALLDRALTHRSYCAEHGVAESNERLEFLGDSVLGFVVTKFVYAQHPTWPEGELAKLRAVVVSAETLAELARRVEVGPALRLGKGEDASGGRAKPSILSDAMEAVFAAVYLDGGLDVASRVILQALDGPIREQAAGPGGSDFKTRLQELALQRGDPLPRYRVRHEGPDHSRSFFAAVFLGDEVCGEGEGHSKKAAEQAAARVAWQRLQDAREPAAPAPVVSGTGGGDA
jgi:ribonuclease III